ncbi:MAG: hypothetical protein JWN70_3054 [Planctomycetaceae bacterium]|nr:hypothetical protein [Planctomycetaceae bacterium]
MRLRQNDPELSNSLSPLIRCQYNLLGVPTETSSYRFTTS